MNWLGGIWLGFVASALVAVVVWYRACWYLGRLWDTRTRRLEWHHFYIGFSLVALPWHWWIGWWSLAVWAVGWWIAWDDAHLHQQQATWWRRGQRKLTGADDMSSFWHRLAARAGLI